MKLDDYKTKLMKNRKEFIFPIEYFFVKGAALTERGEKNQFGSISKYLAKRNFSLMVPKVGIKGDLAIGPDFLSLVVSLSNFAPSLVHIFGFFAPSLVFIFLFFFLGVQCSQNL